jgi:hypothetical protein
LVSAAFESVKKGLFVVEGNDRKLVTLEEVLFSLCASVYGGALQGLGRVRNGKALGAHLKTYLNRSLTENE